MALQAPTGFAGGPMTDDDFGLIVAAGASVAIKSGFEVTYTGAGSSRQLSISDGDSIAYGVRVRNVGAMLPSVLTAPGSGSAWYLVVLRRDWVNKSASIVVLAGPTSGGTTTPAAPPAAYPATLQLAPGSSQLDQPLAWAWAVAGSSTLTVFDSRLTIDGLGGISVPDPWALQACIGTLINTARTQGGQVFSEAPTISMAQFSPNGPTDTTNVVRASRWVGRGGSGVAAQYRPLHTLRVSTTATLTALATLMQSGTVPRVQLYAQEATGFVEGGNGVTYLFVGAGNVQAIIGDAPAAAAWQAWDRAPAAYTPAINNLNWTAFAIRVAVWGIKSGVYWSDAFIAQSGTAAPTASADLVWVQPSSMLGGLGKGPGKFNPAGSSSAGAELALACFPIGTVGQSTTTVRVRALVSTAAAAGIRQNIFGSVVTAGAANDSIELHVEGPSGAYA